MKIRIRNTPLQRVEDALVGLPDEARTTVTQSTTVRDLRRFLETPVANFIC